MNKKALILSITILSLLNINFSSSFAQNPSACKLADQALEVAAKIRHLIKFKNVPCQVEDKATIRKFIEERITEELGLPKLEEESLRLKALGIIPKVTDYKKIIIDLYESQVAGYYDNIKKRFVMASWLADSIQLGIAVHEQTHALQDQHFDLTKFLELKEHTTDELLARSALVEGDASLVMYEQTNQSIGMPSLRDLPNVNMYIMQNVIATGFLAQSNPDAANLMQLMIFPYSSGLHFVHYLLKKEGFRTIDSAFKRPPNSTEEILHPEKFGEKSEFEKLNFEELNKALSLKDKIFAFDTLGEFFLGLYLKTLGLDPSLATKAAAGWAGDGFALSETKQGLAYWLILFDSQAESDEFVQICSKIFAEKKIEFALLMHNLRPAIRLKFG